MKTLNAILFFIVILVSSCEDQSYKPSKTGNTPEIISESFTEVIPRTNIEIEENPATKSLQNSVSTFSIDADGASYANVRRFITEDKYTPPPGAVRVEEMINYFDLDYKIDDSNHPISLNGEISECPWNMENNLVRIGIKGKDLAKNDHLNSNFVLLVDVSGSMEGEDRLDLLKRGFKDFVNQMHVSDRVAIVTYAGSAGVALASTSGANKQKIIKAINSLEAGGSTAGAAGIRKAYHIAEQNYILGGNNRIIFASDGDFNVGMSSQRDLVNLIKSKRDKGIFLSIFGVGRGNLNDATMEQIANHGNGNYEYIDHFKQLKKVFIYDYEKFFTVAKDVKVQVKFNPDQIESYRLIGYENRVLSESDFTNDNTDAGEIGAGQNITALYEVKFRETYRATALPSITVDFKYKFPNQDYSYDLSLDIFDKNTPFMKSSDFMKFTAAVASYSMLLTNSEYRGTSNTNNILQWLNSTRLKDEYGFKKEFKSIVRQTSGLMVAHR